MADVRVMVVYDWREVAHDWVGSIAVAAVCCLQNTNAMLVERTGALRPMRSYRW